MTGKNWRPHRKAVFQSKQKFILALAIVMVLIAGSVAQGAFFDTAGQSARPMGMGEIFIASTGDASSYWYNPAGLSLCRVRQLDISYGIITPSIASDLMKYQLNYVNPLGERSGFGLGISGLGADGASEMAISGAYGVSIGENLAVGGNVKVLRWAIEGQYDPYNNMDDDDLSKVSFSLDLSATYGLGELFGLADFTTGVYVKNAIMPNISESGDDGGKLPIEIGLGVMGQKAGVIGEADAAFVNGETVFHGGVEFPITGSNLKVRGGLIYGSDFEDDTEKTDFNVGFGYTFSSLVFDYAYNLPLAFDETGGRHFISFGYSF